MLSGMFGKTIANDDPKILNVFLLQESSDQWCSYIDQNEWKGAVRASGAMVVAELRYSQDKLTEIDVTETDESGDWTVFDHYFLDTDNNLKKLSRLINVLPGDRSVLETFSIADGKTKKISTEAKQLSTGKPLSSPPPTDHSPLAFLPECLWAGFLARPLCCAFSCSWSWSRIVCTWPAGFPAGCA